MTLTGIQPILQGTEPDQQEMYTNLKPVRYRYVMAYLHAEKDDNGVLHQPGEVLATLPMTDVLYRVGLYSGTEFTGNVYLPDMFLDQMPHPPSNDFERRIHPDQQGLPIGSMFKCGNRAIYVMRNEKVVWGGVLWTRSYTSSTPMLSVSAVSWEGYAYYRLLRRSVVFKVDTNVYTIWYALLKQLLTDFTWPGVKGKHGYVNSGVPPGEAQKIYTDPITGKITTIAYVPWTGHTANNHSNVPLASYRQQWPHNSPDIELPPSGLKLYKDPKAKPPVEVKATKEFRGYDMGTVGQSLQEWADTETVASVGGGKRFEYRVLCWFDVSEQRFRQRYVFGNMTYADGKGPNTQDPTPIGIANPLLGRNTEAIAKDSERNKLVYEFPGSVSEWSLSETMDAAATRVVVTDTGDRALKHAEYAWDKQWLDKPSSGTNRGSQGFLLYDQLATYDTKSPSLLQARAERLLELFHVPVAKQLSDLADIESGQHSSVRSTTLQVTLYQDPTTPFPEFELGDWVVFAIEDPFYGGKMYLVRRIIGYTVTVTPDHESDYSHETYELELTDDTKVVTGE